MLLMPYSKILIEGLTTEELLNIEELESLTVTGAPLVFSAGSADILAEFAIEEQTLKVELAVIENGGEGVLPKLISVIERSAVKRGIVAIEWWIYGNRSHPPRVIPEAALYSGCPGSMSPKQGLAFPLLDPGSRFARPG
jgi:hypothetical protein